MPRGRAGLADLIQMRHEAQHCLIFAALIDERFAAAERGFRGAQKLQDQLLEKGAVNVDPILMSIEKRGRMMFEFWSKFVLKKGGPWDPAREFRLKLFKYYLFTGAFLLPPLISSVSWVTQKIFYKKTKRLQTYYSQVD